MVKSVLAVVCVEAGFSQIWSHMMLGHDDSKHKIDFNHPVYMECIANDRSGSLHFCLYNQIEGLAICWNTS